MFLATFRNRQKKRGKKSAIGVQDSPPLFCNAEYTVRVWPKRFKRKAFDNVQNIDNKRLLSCISVGDLLKGRNYVEFFSG